MVHGCTMMGGGFLRARRFLPTTRRERALATKLHDTRTSLATIAAGVRTFSAVEDARTHLMVKAARERRSGTAESATCDPELAASPGLTHEIAQVAQFGLAHLSWLRKRARPGRR